MPVIDTMFSMRASASRGVLACTVVSEPSWPVFIACSMSSASPPRTSPSTMRSGRIRRLLRTRSRCVTAPRPSMLGGRVSSRTTCGCCSCSSAESSIVTMRSCSGMKPESRLSSVVLPAPVPPETTTFSRPRTIALMTCATAGVRLPNWIRSSIVNSSTANRRIESTGAVERKRRNDRVDARTILEPRVDHRRRLIDAPADGRHDAIDDVQQVRIVRERHVRQLELAAALDVHLIADRSPECRRPFCPPAAARAARGRALHLRCGG